MASQKATEKKVMTALAKGEYDRIKATEEFIETLLGHAQETIDLNQCSIEDEEAKGTAAREDFITKLEEQNDFLRIVIANGEEYLENAHKIEDMFEYED